MISNQNLLATAANGMRLIPLEKSAGDFRLLRITECYDNGMLLTAMRGFIIVGEKMNGFRDIRILSIPLFWRCMRNGCGYEVVRCNPLTT